VLVDVPRDTHHTNETMEKRANASSDHMYRTHPYTNKRKDKHRPLPSSQHTIGQYKKQSIIPYSQSIPRATKTPTRSPEKCYIAQWYTLKPDRHLAQIHIIPPDPEERSKRKRTKCKNIGRTPRCVAFCEAEMIFQKKVLSKKTP